jgi:hypothetical protein
MSTPTGKDVCTPLNKRQRVNEHGLSGPKSVRWALIIDAIDCQQPQQQQHHDHVLDDAVDEEQEEQDLGGENPGFAAHNDDIRLFVPPIPPEMAPVNDPPHDDHVNNGPQHPDKSKIMDEFQQYVQDSLKKGLGWTKTYGQGPNCSIFFTKMGLFCFTTRFWSGIQPIWKQKSVLPSPN